MPGIILHTELAKRLIERWQASSETAPFPLRSRSARRTFFVGCMGPDMGYLPGCDPFLSDLVHYVRSGELTRILVRLARSETERAFAFGWFSHVLADVLIHPIINEAAALVRGANVPQLTFADDPALHVAVELGVDGSRLERTELPTDPLSVSLAPEFDDYLARCFDEVYGPVLSRATLSRNRHRSARWSALSIRVTQAAAEQNGFTPSRQPWFRTTVYRPLRWATSILAPRSILHAMTHPLRPPGRIRDAIDATVDGFVDRFLEADLDTWPDYNLDTGTVEEPITYPLAVRTLDRVSEAGHRANAT